MFGAAAARCHIANPWALNVKLLNYFTTRPCTGLPPRRAAPTALGSSAAEDTRYADSLGPLGEGGGLFSSDPFTSDGFDATSMAFSAPLATSLRNAKVTSGTSTFLGSETTVLDDASRLLEGRPTHPSSAQELQEASKARARAWCHAAVEMWQEASGTRVGKPARQRLPRVDTASVFSII